MSKDYICPLSLPSYLASLPDLDQTFLGRISFFDKRAFWSNIFYQTFFWVTCFLTKFFWTNFFNQNIFGPKSFWTNFVLVKIIFWPQNFWPKYLYQNYLCLTILDQFFFIKIFLNQNIFRTDILPDQKFLPKYLGLTFFLC